MGFGHSDFRISGGRVKILSEKRALPGPGIHGQKYAMPRARVAPQTHDGSSRPPWCPRLEKTRWTTEIFLPAGYSACGKYPFQHLPLVIDLHALKGAPHEFSRPCQNFRAPSS